MTGRSRRNGGGVNVTIAQDFKPIYREDVGKGGTMH